MAKKKQITFMEAAMAAAASYKHAGGSWFDRLPKETQDELLEVRKAVREGKIHGPGRCIARAIVQLCIDRGFKVCGSQGVETWLREKK